MKQNKRFWLVAIALLLATLMVSGLALADKSIVESVRGGEKGADGKWKTEYTFYAIENEKGDGYVGLNDEKGNLGADNQGSTTLTVEIPNGATGASQAGHILFDYNGNHSYEDEFFFETVPADAKGVKITKTGNKSATITWTPNKDNIKDYTLKISAIDGYDDKGNPIKGANETFTIHIEKIKTVGLKVTNSTNKDPKGTFNYNLTDQPNDNNYPNDGKLWIVTGYEKDGYTAIIRGTNRFGFVWEKNIIDELDPDAKGDRHVAITADVKFDILYTPSTARKIASNYTNRVENKIAGFTFQPQNSSVGKLEQPMKYAQVARPATYFDWNQKAGKVEIVITPIDKDQKAIADLGTDTATLSFNEVPETVIDIKSKSTDAEKTECTVLRIEVEETKSVYHFSTYDEKGELINKWFETEIHITDKKDNDIEPTYVLEGDNEKLRDLVWSSSDPSIIRVTKDGKITGIKVGKAEAIATGHFGVQGKVKVEVIEEAKSKITSIKFNQDSLKYELPIYSSRPVRAYVLTEPYGMLDYEVESSDPSIIRIEEYYTDADGNRHYYNNAPLMFPIKKGTAKITVYPKGKPEVKATATFTVVESEVTAKFLQDEVNVALKKGINLTTYLTKVDPDGVTSKTIWTVSDPAIATVSDYGYVTGKKVGTATVTATLVNSSDDVLATASIKVNVGKQAVTGVAFEKDAYTVTRGESVDLFVTVTPITESFNGYDYTFTYDDDVIDYDYDDNKVIVIGEKAGTATLTMTNKADETISAKATITVEQVKIDSIKLTKDSINLYLIDAKSESTDSDNSQYKNDYFSNYTKFAPSKYWTSSKDFWTYESSDEGIALVRDDGYIYATGIGTATVTGTYDDGLNKFELKMTVKVKGNKKADPEPEPAKSNPIVVEPEDGKYYINVVKGAKNEKQLIVYDAVTGEEVDVKWASKDTKMATVSKAGVVKAKGKGRVVITATTLDGTQKYNIGLTLNQKPVEQINVLFNKVELKVGEKFIVGASVYPKHAYNQELGYKSSNKKVVTVDGGILTAKKPGTATITISAKDGSGVKTTVEVTVVK